jgi:HEAT repeat protein
VPRSIALLSHPETRRDAAAALGAIGFAARGAIPMLCAALKHRDPAYRFQAAQSLGLMAIHWSGNRPSQQRFPASGVAALGGALKDRDRRVRIAALRAFGRIGARAATASHFLTPLLHDPDPEIRLAALRDIPAMLGRQGASPHADIAACLKDPDRRVRLAALDAIWHKEVQEDPVISGLLSVMNDRDADIRAQACFKLALINAKDGIWVAEGMYYQADLSSEPLARSSRAGAILRSALVDPDRRVRAAAAYSMPVFKNEATASVPLLIERLEDPSPFVRVAAALALGQLAHAARAALPRLFQSLQDPGTLPSTNVRVSSRSAQAILSISPDHTGALVDRLLAMLGDRRESIREMAAAALKELRTSLSAALFAAVSEDRTPKAVKAQILAVLAGENSPGFADTNEPHPLTPAALAAIPALRQLVSDDDPEIRVPSLGLLMLLEPGRHSRAEALLDLVRNGEIDLSHLVINFGEPSREDVERLLSALADPDEVVRIVAAAALGELSDDLASNRENQADQAEQPDEQNKDRSRPAAPGNRIIEALVRQLDAPDSQTRWAAAWALGPYGPGGNQQRPKVVSRLIGLVKDRSTCLPPDCWILDLLPQIMNATAIRSQPGYGPALRLAAMQALGTYGEQAADAVPALMEALRDESPAARLMAVEALGGIGPNARPAVPMLIDMLRATREPRQRLSRGAPGGMCVSPAMLRAAAASALGRIKPEGRVAVPALIDELNEGGHVAQAAIQALGELGGEDPRAAEALRKVLCDDPDEAIATHAAMALVALGQAAVPALVQALRDPDADVRYRVAGALGQLGPAAAAAIAALQRVADDVDPDVRQAVADALKVIRNPKGEEPAAPALEAPQDAAPPQADASGHPSSESATASMVAGALPSSRLFTKT